MSNTQRFADIAVGTNFIHEGKQYVKIKDQRVTCCKVFNATLPNDPNQKFFIVPITEVEVTNND
jgi:hypothetical protein